MKFLNAILKVLKDKNVHFKFEQKWIGWDKEDIPTFDSGLSLSADYYVFSLGGGSWKVTGSDGKWLDIFAKKGITTKAFQASNCAFHVKWPEQFILKNAGLPLKNITISSNKKTQKGEVVITDFGLEGNAIYALSPEIQDDLNQKKKAVIYLDLKPTLSHSDLLDRYNNSTLKKPSDILRKVLKLSKAHLELLKAQTDKATFLNPDLLISTIKKLPLTILMAAPIDEAISTSGGIILDEVDEYFKIKKLNNTFSIGEMLDWNAPTGGYLLQACFSMGVYLARRLNQIENKN